MNQGEFNGAFHELPGNKPLHWQKRLFREYFSRTDDNATPRIIDLPTGLGKTMIMAIWLIARQVNKTLPRRLIDVVDRRTVVDQATQEAETLIKN